MSAVSLLSSPTAALATQSATTKTATAQSPALALPSSGADAAAVTATGFTASAPLAPAAAASGDTRFLHVTQYPSSLQTVNVTYEALANLQTRNGRMQVWEQAPTTAVDQIIGRNASATSQSARFAGLGSALLEQVASTGASYRQTIVNVAAAYSPDKIQGKAADAQWAIRSSPSASAALTIKTQSGASVRISLADQRLPVSTGAGMAVQIDVEGDLTPQEQQALQSLAKGFDEAMEGLTREPPLVNLDGLMKFDSKLLTRVELKSEVYGLNDQGERAMVLGTRFTASADSREIELKTLKGTATVKTDLRQSAIWGSAEQKARAVQQYLSRVDKAAERGNGNQELVDLFKSSFAALHGGYGDSDKASGLTRVRPADITRDADAFSEEDRSLLTGMADFNASIVTNRRAVNPRRTNEIDIFDYRIGQSTQISGGSAANRAITQTQTSDLSAGFHRSLRSRSEPELSSDSATQNYYYTQVEDHSSTRMELAYEKDKPVRALLTQAASQFLRTIKVEFNKVVETMEEPLQQQSQRKDLLPMLEQLLRREEAEELSSEEKERTLREWNAMVLGGPGAA
ncbi:hypothetical protein [Acidovorax sp.]|uniref:hypothetical protein n=1 Tax=Acidovorax sp. TaxID=1872122 RepID=UPI002ACDF252|nr:hypothetical protein [Acidovorax sp.]MDZ7862504.1 hypothetical protein [Acidovorax sp.]